MKRLLSLIAAIILTTSLLPIYALETKAEIQSIPMIEDPTPGYWETSEYLIGSVAVGIIFPESNGTIDPSTEDWTDEEIEKVLSKVQYALDWWASQNPNANVSFITEVHARVPTSYELISHNWTDIEQAYAKDEIMTYLGYPANYSLQYYTKYQMQDYLNGLRKKFNTDWALEVDIIDASNDSDGLYADGRGATADPGGPYLQIPVKTTDNLDWRLAHELAHIFWATDEYNGKTEYLGYLNVPDVEGSNCLMQTPGSWNLSGKPHGLNGTWGQIGWRDSDKDGIQDIVDTPNEVYVNPATRMGNTINITGVATVTAYPNRNRWTKNPEGKRSVTINVIKSVQYRIDGGEWLNATITPWKFKKLVRYPSTYEDRETYAVVNFTFLTPELSTGEHFIEVRATNQWGNEGYANLTVTIPQITHDVAITNLKPYRAIISNNTLTSINVTAMNKGDTKETFNLTLYCNDSIIETKTLNLESKELKTLTFRWNTTGPPGNYTLKAEASQVQGETNSADNLMTVEVRISISGDINNDKVVNIVDLSIAAIAYQSFPSHPKWNSNADVNEDGIINIMDLSIIAKEYGKTI